MATDKLNSKFCDNAPKGNHFDGGGLYLMVTPDLKRYWRLTCYLNGKRKLLGLGRYPQVSLKEAREKRREMRALVEQGVDPVAEKQRVKEEAVAVERQEAANAGNTLEQIARRLYESKAGRVTEDSRDKMLRQLEIHVFPAIGHKHLKEIEGKELLSLLRSVAEKTNHGRKMTYMARKLCQWIGEVYDLAHVEDSSFALNPCRVVIKHLPKHDGQHMPRVGFEELPAFLRALEAYGGHLTTKAAIWMLLYTGQRQASVRRAVWGNFDLVAAVWHRRPEKFDKLPHDLPLPKQAVKLLQSIRPLTGQGEGDLVFPSVRSTKYMMSEASVCQAIRRMGFEMVGHGLRAVVSTGLNELGFDARMVDVQLGHKNPDTTEAAYNDAKHFKKRAKMMQTWADHMAGAVAVKPVLQMKKRA